MATDNIHTIPAETVLDGIAQQCGATAEKSGFREDYYLANELERFAEEFAAVDWDSVSVENIDSEREMLQKAAQALRISYIGMKLALMHSEISEALETLRDEGVEGIMAGKGNFGEELADLHIRAWDLEEMLGILTGRSVKEKMERNRNRPYMHGRRA